MLKNAIAGHHAHPVYQDNIDYSISNAALVGRRDPWAPTQSLDRYLRSYKMAFDRVANIRKKTFSGSSQVHAFDRTLAQPEQFKSSTLRALIHLSKRVEELAEAVSDISGVTERFTRNLISSGDQADMAQVIGSAVGRIVSSQLYCGGVAIHKVIGTGLYLVTGLISLGVLAYSNSRYVARRSPAEIEFAIQQAQSDTSYYRMAARRLLASKESVIEKLMEKTANSNNTSSQKVHKWAKCMSRKYRAKHAHLASKQQAYCSYIWANLHQYGPVTRSLMHVAQGIFLGINKLGVSFDKHIGAAVGTYLLGKRVGDILGCRIGLTLSVASAAAISVPLAPFIVGISGVGAVACGVAFVAMGLAKMNVVISKDWKGNIQKPTPSQVFGRVTPT